jgi:parallel beta-helix repeat protein
MKIKRIKMKKNMFGMLVCSLIFFSVIYVPYTTPALNTISLKQISPLILTIHEAICITCDQNFTDYSFAGAGIPGDPYKIENLKIDATTGIGIDINGTTVDFVIRNCYIEAQSHAIVIKNTSENTVIIENNVCINSIHGIRIVNSPKITVTNNNCSYNMGTAIQIESSDYSQIENNVCSNNIEYGVYFRESSYVTVYNNTLTSNSLTSIYSHWSNESSILNNTCMHSDNWFIYIRNSEYVESKYNRLYNSTKWEGILISDSVNCLFSYNLIQECEGGIHMAMESENNIFHHNTLVNNHFKLLGEDSHQATDWGDGNIWYDTTTNEGNFWDDHDDSSEYEILGEANSIDPYPLSEPTMEPFGEEEASFPFAFILPVLVLIVLLFKNPKKIRVEKSNRR